MKEKALNFFKNHTFFSILLGFTLIVFIVNIRLNLFRYNNFEFGKFDLGNMTQMVWNTIHGDFMYLTDYFGTNLPRWAMSHVDPIMLFFIVPFLIFPSPLALVFSQLILVLFSSLLIYFIAKLHLKSRFLGLIFGLAYLTYPALGFLTAWTGFHGVSVVIPTFLAAFYIFEKMYKNDDFNKKSLVIFWILLIITMMGKEQISLYIFMFGLFVALFRKKIRLGITMSLVGLIWFVVCFFVIIPHYAPYRTEGFAKFADSLNIDRALVQDVEKPNYFLSRYEGFGDSYLEIIINLMLNPAEVVRVIFAGDKIENIEQTFSPLMYAPLAYPAIFMIALPDLLINYLTTEGGIGTSEIYNHRISMIIPVLFISSIYAVGLLRGRKIKKIDLAYVVAIALLISNIHTTFAYQNPVYLWFTQAITKRLPQVFAKTDMELTAQLDTLEIGDSIDFSPLDNQDRECAARVVAEIPDNVSVSGPDFLGAHLSMRKTYAIFPALYNEADYVIVDVFSRKLTSILGINNDLIRDVVGDIIKDENYQLSLGCGNLFVFHRVGPHGKNQLLPIQEKFEYEEKFQHEITRSLNVVDYQIPAEIKRGDNFNTKTAYLKVEGDNLNDYVLYTSFVHAETGEIFQIANIYSFGLNQLQNWDTGVYYIEEATLVAPKFLETGKYKIFIGMSNSIRNRNLYLGDVSIL